MEFQTHISSKYLSNMQEGHITTKYFDDDRPIEMKYSSNEPIINYLTPNNHTNNRKRAGTIIVFIQKHKDTPDKIFIVMVLQRASNNLGFPKGSIKRTEKLSEAAARETKEEIGVSIDPFDLENLVRDKLFISSSKHKLMVVNVNKKPILCGCYDNNQNKEILSRGWYLLDDIKNKIKCNSIKVSTTTKNIIPKLENILKNVNLKYTDFQNCERCQKLNTPKFNYTLTPKMSRERI